MSFRLRVYAPIDGVRQVQAAAISGGVFAYGTPQGVSTACIDEDYITTGVRISATLEANYAVSQWVVNIDGAVRSQTGSVCTVSYASSASNVQVRLEVVYSPPTTYYATLNFDAAGGSGAPASISNTSTRADGYVPFTIPYAAPYRAGYTFLGWSANQAGSGKIYQPGASDIWWGSTYPGGAVYTLYAVWADAGGSVYIFTGSGWQKAVPYVYNGGWQKAAPHIFTGGWTKTK